jgi:putative transcriptional regulator
VVFWGILVPMLSPFISAASTAAIRVATVLVMMSAPGVMAAEMMAADMANGIFLVAKHEMKDPRFREAVLLVTQPRLSGPFGVIINRPLKHPLSEVFPEQPGLKARKEVLYFGGPVSSQGIMFLVRTSTPPDRALHVLKDVYFTGDKEWIEALFRRPDPLRGLRAFAGYSGWGPGQLQNELRRGDWYVLPADANTIFEKDPARIWPDLIKRASARPTGAVPQVRQHAGAF